MAQNICVRCGNSYHDLYRCADGYCSKCEAYRKEVMEKVRAELRTKHENNWGNYHTCRVCHGDGVVGRNRIHCSNCDGKGRVMDLFYLHDDDIKKKHYKKLPGNFNEKGGCFISTACVVAQGLPDNCKQLQILRNFRNNFVMKQEKGLEDVAEYYRIAPKIVRDIDLRDNSSEIYELTYERWIKKAISLIQRGDSKGAYQQYKEMTCQFKKEFLLQG